MAELQTDQNTTGTIVFPGADTLSPRIYDIASGEEPSIGKQRAAQRIQFEYRLHLAYRMPLNIGLAMRMADDRMPHADDGRLYRCKPLTEPCRSWRDGAPVPGFSAYYRLGVGIALYMRMVRGGRNLILPLVLVSLVPLIYNLTGTKAKGAEAAVYVVHSLGNSDELSVLAHGLPDAVIVLLAMVILCYCARSNRAVAAELNPRRGTKRSVIDYTVMIEGLPRDPSLSFESLVTALRQLLGAYGDVVCCSLARANRKHLQLLRVQQDLKMQLHYYRIAAHRAPLGSDRLAARAKVEAKLKCIGAEIDALCNRPVNERASCAGVGFVTFNYPADAGACMLDLRKNPQRTLMLKSLQGGGIVDVRVALKASVPPPPSQVLWENLQFSLGSRVCRRWIVNSILLLQCTLSTYAIVQVTNMNVADTLDVNSSTKLGTTLWTTLIIILSNLLIFLTAPAYAEFFERDIRLDHRETQLAMKLTFFQLVNSFAAALSFLWTKQGGARGFFDRAWYTNGGATTVISMVLADIFFINPFVEGMRIFDVLIAKTLLAPRAMAQEQMNRVYAAENPLYLPFRMQLLLKQLVYGLAWSYSFPVFFLLVLVYLAMSVVVDESGLFRTSDRGRREPSPNPCLRSSCSPRASDRALCRFKGIVSSSDKMYDAAVTQVLPAALMLHCLISFFMAYHMELENRGLLHSGLLHSSVELDATLRSPAVALALAMLVFSAVFGLVFVTAFKATRHFIKHKPRHSSAASETNSSASPTQVAFRELDYADVNLQLYVPPLTTLLVATARRRTSSQSYKQYQLWNRDSRPLKMVDLSSVQAATAEKSVEFV